MRNELVSGKDYIGVGVGALIIKNNEVLLLLRNKEPEAGSWTIIGGKVEFGERIEDAVLREVREEIGVEGKIVANLGVTNHIMEVEKIHYVSTRFLVEIEGKPYNVEINSHKDMKWFNVDKLPDNITLTTKEALQAFEDFRNSL